MRMLIHNYTEKYEINIGWVDEYTCRIELKRPDYYASKCLRMMGLDTYDVSDGSSEVERYPSNHKIYNIIGTNASMMETDSKIASLGLYRFDHSIMDIPNPIECNIFEVPCDNV